MDLVGREREIFRILEILSNSTIEFIVVGGYAVSALAKHRFSVDCDLVVRRTEMIHLDSVLKKEGFVKQIEKDEFDKAYGGRFIRYVKKIDNLPVSVDLLVDSLVSRQTEASWSFQYILSNSSEGRVVGTSSSVKARVPKRELLMAFKLHSARKPDVRDIVMLGEEASWKEILYHLNRGDQEKLQASLRQVIGNLAERKLVDSLKGEFVLQGDVTSSILKSKLDVEKTLDELPRLQKHPTPS